MSIDKDITGRVSRVAIRAGAVMYEISWWDGRQHCVDWFDEFEVKAFSASDETLRIGFD